MKWTDDGAALRRATKRPLLILFWGVPMNCQTPPLPCGLGLRQQHFPHGISGRRSCVALDASYVSRPTTVAWRGLTLRRALLSRAAILCGFATVVSGDSWQRGEVVASSTKKRHFQFSRHTLPNKSGRLAFWGLCLLHQFTLPLPLLLTFLSVCCGIGGENIL